MKLTAGSTDIHGKIQNTTATNSKLKRKVMGTIKIQQILFFLFWERKPNGLEKLKKKKKESSKLMQPQHTCFYLSPCLPTEAADM